MTFSSEQRQALAAKLRIRHVKTRFNLGTPIAYVEGWHVIAEANRIFGFDAWDRDTVSPQCIWKETVKGQTACLYTAKVRITVRAGAAIVVRDGVGTGSGRAASADMAHEIALKAAETDATKRALATFGNPFGLALYDKDRSQVTKVRRRTAAMPNPQSPADGEALKPAEFILFMADGSNRIVRDAQAFVAGTLAEIETISTVDALYGFWQANLESFAALRRWCKGGQRDDAIATIVTALKARARAVAASTEAKQVVRPATQLSLALPKERRFRSKPHLLFVAQQPCLVCGRRPAQAHHLRFAQSRAMALKVSDEFTVPLCNVHHDSLHRTGDERAWWARHGVLDPLKMAARLWAASRLNRDFNDETPLEDGPELPLPPIAQEPAADSEDPRA